MFTKELYAHDLEQIRSTAPLIHHITNLVSMNDLANIVLAIGGSPVMAPSIDEVEDMVGLAKCLVLNIGTLSKPEIESMLCAGRAANARKVPIILDPVGAGATRLRTESALLLIDQLKISVIRGNGGEIGALLGEYGQTKGVDSARTHDLDELSVQASQRFQTVVGVSGKIDYLSDGKHLVSIDNGTPFFQKITGAGCMVTSLIGTFMAVNHEFLTAATHGFLTYNVSGEVAEQGAAGPATFRNRLFDTLYCLDASIVAEREKIEWRNI